jgi:hypothetical protein
LCFLKVMFFLAAITRHVYIIHQTVVKSIGIVKNIFRKIEWELKPSVSMGFPLVVTRPLMVKQAADATRYVVCAVSYAVWIGIGLLRHVRQQDRFEPVK